MRYSSSVIEPGTGITRAMSLHSAVTLHHINTRNNLLEKQFTKLTTGNCILLAVSDAPQPL